MYRTTSNLHTNARAVNHFQSVDFVFASDHYASQNLQGTEKGKCMWAVKSSLRSAWLISFTNLRYKVRETIRGSGSTCVIRSTDVRTVQC